LSEAKLRIAERFARRSIGRGPERGAPASELYRAIAANDRFVDLLAGIHVWCERLDALLARDTRCEERVPTDAVDAMLGLVALRDKVTATLVAHARDVAPDHAPGSARESLLR